MEKRILERCAQDGFRRIPEAIKNAPELLPGLEFYYDTFWELDSCRQQGMSLGPIPWTAIQKFGEVMKLDEETLDDLHYFIRSLDNKYRLHMESKNGNKT